MYMHTWYTSMVYSVSQIMMYFLRKNFPIVLTLLISCVVIAVTYWFVWQKKENTENITEGTTTTFDAEENTSVNLNEIRDIQPEDHILGNPQAPIVIFVYSDFSCPYCADYHKTLRVIMRTFGSEGKVAIVFRHMPIVQLHPEAPMYALASECVARELGNGGFWDFADDMFRLQDPLKPFSSSELVVLAEEIGVTRQNFVACMRTNDLMSIVEKGYDEGIKSGADGAPYTVIQVEGERKEYYGAQTYKTLAVIIQTLSRGLDSMDKDFEATDTAHFENGFDVSDSKDVATTTSSTTSSQKQESILDGIIPE